MTTPPLPPCRSTLENISAYLDGELDATTCEAIDRHSLDCGGCAALLEGLRTTIGLCRQAAAGTLPDAVRERAKTAIRRLLDEEPFNR